MIITGKSVGIVCVDPLDKIGITSDGGYAVKMQNQTGGATTKGYIVHPSTSTDGAFTWVGNDEPDILGAVFGDDDGNQVANGEDCWIVIKGWAYIYSRVAATRGWFIRSLVAADSGNPGEAIAEALPAAPFTTQKHFQECGHCMETTVGAGLVLCITHHN